MITTESTLLPLARETELSSECDKDKLGLIVKEQSKGVSGWETTKTRHQGRGIPADLRGFLLKAGQGLRHQRLGVGWDENPLI